MQRPASLLFSAYLVGAVLPAAAQDRFELLSSCAAAASHVEQRECLERKMKISLAALQAAEKSLSSKLRDIDQEPVQKLHAVAAAQTDARAFTNYAEKHCEAFAALAYGGNSQGDRRLACHIELNMVRTRQLNKVTEATS
jgi:uncharacterized protein YecT (DUF1311 family)